MCNCGKKGAANKQAQSGVQKALREQFYGKPATPAQAPAPRKK